MYNDLLIVTNLVEHTLNGNYKWEYSDNSKSYIYIKKISDNKNLRFQLVPTTKQYVLYVTYTSQKNDCYITNYLKTMEYETMLQNLMNAINGDYKKENTSN